MSVLSGVVRTPLVPYRGPRGLWEEIWLKDETKQVTGAFKFRGNLAKLSKLRPESRVVTASTGNHGYGLSTAAQIFGLPATIFVPTSTPRAKIAGMLSVGAQIELIQGDYTICTNAAVAYAEETGAVYIPSFDDLDVIEGHRTMFQEIDSAGLEADTVFVPVGGGGLLAAALLQWGGTRKIVGVESQTAPAMQQALAQGYRVCLEKVSGSFEGLLVRQVGAIPFDVCQRFQPEIRTVREDEIELALSTLWRANGIRAEGAGAASLAAALSTRATGRKCLCVVSGGNIDEDNFLNIINNWTDFPGA